MAPANWGKEADKSSPHNMGDTMKAFNWSLQEYKYILIILLGDFDKNSYKAKQKNRIRQSGFLF